MSEFDRAASIAAALNGLSLENIAYLTETQVAHGTEAGREWCTDLRDRILINFSNGNVDESDLWESAAAIAEGMIPRGEAAELARFVVLAVPVMRLYASDVDFHHCLSMREIMRDAIRHVETVAAHRLLSLAVDTANAAEAKWIDAQSSIEGAAALV